MPLIVFLGCIVTLYFNTTVRCLSVRTLLRETDQNAVTYSLFFFTKVGYIRGSKGLSGGGAE